MKINIKQNSVKLVIAAGMVVGTASISAASEMDISATVGEACIANIQSALDFGDYDGIIDNATVDKKVEFTVSALCSLDTDGVINIDAGGNSTEESGAITPSRAMANGDNRLNYNLYKNAGYSNIWGAGDPDSDGAGGGNPYTGTGGTTDVVGFAKLPAGQIVPDGVYIDTVTVTVLY